MTQMLNFCVMCRALYFASVDVLNMWLNDKVFLIRCVLC